MSALTSCWAGGCASTRSVASIRVHGDRAGGRAASRRRGRRRRAGAAGRGAPDGGGARGRRLGLGRGRVPHCRGRRRRRDPLPRGSRDARADDARPPRARRPRERRAGATGRRAARRAHRPGPRRRPRRGRVARGRGDGARLTIGAAESILRYCVEKGSITVDGVSLTVAGLDGDTFSIALVPHTLEVTTLGGLEPGMPVNLEVDVLAKYVERLLDRGVRLRCRASARHGTAGYGPGTVP